MTRYVVKANGDVIGHAETVEKAKRVIRKDADERSLVKAKWFETEQDFIACRDRPLPKYTIEKQTIE